MLEQTLPASVGLSSPPPPTPRSVKIGFRSRSFPLYTNRFGGIRFTVIAEIAASRNSPLRTIPFSRLIPSIQRSILIPDKQFCSALEGEIEKIGFLSHSEEAAKSLGVLWSLTLPPLALYPLHLLFSGLFFPYLAGCACCRNSPLAFPYSDIVSRRRASPFFLNCPLLKFEFLGGYHEDFSFRIVLRSFKEESSGSLYPKRCFYRFPLSL